MKYAQLILAAMMIVTGLHAADYQLPFEGTWFVGQGGDTPNVNHHMALRSQWYGVDFLKVGGAGGRELQRTDGKSAEDFFSWGAPVLAPADGVVAEIENARPDNPMGQTDGEHPAGNFVKIKVSDGEYAFLAHFQKGSILVKPGDVVKRGQVLGKCGNSGNTTAPHIHLHVQTEAAFNTGEGRNIAFKGIDVLLSGKRFINVDWPMIRGLFVSNTARPQ